MLSDWIVYRLAAVHVTEPSCGSSSGMFSLAERRWSDSIAQICGIPAAVLPPVVDPGTVVGSVTAQAAAQTGLRPGTPVVAGGADTQLGLLGAGVQAGEFTVLAGTFWQNTVLVEKPLIDPAIAAQDAVPRHAGRVDAGGHRVLLRHGNALVPGRVLRRRGRHGAQPRPRPVRGDGGSGGANQARLRRRVSPSCRT